jgi:hypothetical protein
VNAPSGPVAAPLGEATATRELDSQLRDAGLGYRGAGWRAARLAERLAVAVDQLIDAAIIGRTRARGDVTPYPKAACLPRPAHQT